MDSALHPERRRSQYDLRDDLQRPISTMTPSLFKVWLNGSGQSLGSGSTLTLNNSYLVGSTITAIATLTDTYGASDTQSAVITIDNTDPTVLNSASISASPSPSSLADCLPVVPVLQTSMMAPCLHPILGLCMQAVPLAPVQPILIDANSVSPTDTISCEASATDNNGSTASSTASITVDNTNPSVNSVLISPSTVYVDSTVMCSYTATDVDSGSLKIPVTCGRATARLKAVAVLHTTAP